MSDFFNFFKRSRNTMCRSTLKSLFLMCHRLSTWATTLTAVASPQTWSELRRYNEHPNQQALNNWSPSWDLRNIIAVLFLTSRGWPDLSLICSRKTPSLGLQQAASCYNNVLNAIIKGQVLKSFQLGINSDLIVDASERAVGAVLEQRGHPVLCISRRLSKSEINYSQTQEEALAIVWAVRRLHKYLFGAKFKIISDHQALQHIFNPDSSVGKTTSAMLQRWSLELSAYQYEIEHRAGKNIPQADYLSRHAYQQVPELDDTVLMVNPLSIDCNMLIQETPSCFWASAFRNAPGVVHFSQETIPGNLLSQRKHFDSARCSYVHGSHHCATYVS